MRIIVTVRRSEGSLPITQAPQKNLKSDTTFLHRWRIGVNPLNNEEHQMENRQFTIATSVMVAYFVIAIAVGFVLFGGG
jgi:hypothetical protein